MFLTQMFYLYCLTVFVAAQLNAIENVVHVVEKILLLLDLVPIRVHVRVRVHAPEFRLAAVHLTMLHPLTSSTSPALNPAKFVSG